jgi:DNA polymerase-3 subunit delta'
MSALPATFNDFLGNATAIEHLRTAIAAGRLPHSLILAGPGGAGKYTLALMLTMAVECERQPRDLCPTVNPSPPSAESAATAPASPPPPTSTKRWTKQ